MIEDYLEDLVESVSTWNELRAFGETPSELKNCVSMLRRALYTASGEPRPVSYTHLPSHQADLAERSAAMCSKRAFSIGKDHS